MKVFTLLCIVFAMLALSATVSAALEIQEENFDDPSMDEVEEDDESARNLVPESEVAEQERYKIKCPGGRPFCIFHYGK